MNLCALRGGLCYTCAMVIHTEKPTSKPKGKIMSRHYTDSWDAFCELCDQMGEDEALMEIVNAMTDDTLDEYVEFVARMHDVDLSEYER